MRTVSITLDIYASILVTILLAVCVIQYKQSKLINKYLIGWMITHVLMLCCDSFRWRLRGKIEALGMFTAMFFLEYILSYVCLIFFHYYLIDYLGNYVPVSKKLRVIVWPISTVMSVLWILSYQNRIFYTITYNAVNVPNEGYYFSQLPAICLILFDMALVFFHRKRIGWRIAFTLWMYMIFPIIAFPLQPTWNAQILFISMTLSLLIRYATITSEQNRLLAESRAHLAENHIAITMSQIQPHFLYNALGSISALCDIDPVRARDATDHFADYLRMNLESMDRFSPIPFQRELNHIQTYVWLEKMRFGQKLQVEYDIRVKDFQVPALSVQPIVENAVKHGVCARETGGVIVISTRESKEFYSITVRDNGIGFRAEDPADYHDGKLHIGIQNVRSRLKTMVDGRLDIQSSPGTGTVATIQIPKHSRK